MTPTSQDVALLRRRQAGAAPPPTGAWLPRRRGFAIFVPGRLVNPLGSVRHRMVEHKRRKAWQDRVTNALLALGYRRGDFDPAAPKRITLTAHVAARFDQDNLRAVLKPIPDALKERGVIQDDRDSAGHEFVYAPQVIDRACPGVRVEVQMMPETWSPEDR